jgi:hypothetical protein
MIPKIRDLVNSELLWNVALLVLSAIWLAVMSFS